MINTLRVAFFLASRSIRRSSVWSTVLIVAIMTLTFLNLVVVSGILTGLVAGLAQQIRTYYSSDIIIEPEPGRSYINRSAEIIRFLDLNEDVAAYSPRYISSGRIEANFNKSIRADEVSDSATSTIVGIDPQKEDAIAGISQFIVEGEFLNKSDRNQIVLGSDLIFQYLRDPNMEKNTIDNVHIGDRLRLYVNNSMIEVYLKGILKSKVDEISQRMYLTENDLRQIIGRSDLNRGEIVIKLRKGIDPVTIQDELLIKGYGDKNSIKTWQESLGTFFDDISSTFSTLGNFVGSIGLFIASVTVFIIIFVNALNRRKYIGIMKAIGIRKSVIEMSYVMQAMFYSLLGSFIGLILLFFVLVPYFAENPIDFPFSDGILATSTVGALFRACILIAFSLVAAYVPARIIAGQNTVDAILDR